MKNRLANNIEKEMISNIRNLSFKGLANGTNNLDNSSVILTDLKDVGKQLADKSYILKAIKDFDLVKMRNISNFYYKSSGIYSRLCKYAAYMYRYDWMITPYFYKQPKNNKEKENIIINFNTVLNFLEKTQLKKLFGEIALKVIKYGCYYGYTTLLDDCATIQELPINYCRSRFISKDGNPEVEFNMSFFKDNYKNEKARKLILDTFPPEFKKGYKLYEQGKLLPCFDGDTSGWYLLDSSKAVKFSINNDDFPLFIAVVPAILDLDAAQALDKKKMEQQLLKIIIQQMPLDKNGDTIFDTDEIQELHNNAVAMLGKAIGLDVLTTFAQTKVEDLSSSSMVNAADDSMERVRSAIYDQAGVSQLQFNSNTNIALNNSIANDEASLYNLIQQFESFINVVLLANFNKNPKKIYYRAQILATTIYNYKEMSKLYKEQTQLGYSKMLPQIALGQSQSFVLSNAFFENDILDLVNVFIPPMSSNTMSADAITALTENGEAGRPEKDDTEKSDKTIANLESM